MQIAFIFYYENIRIDFPKSNPLELDFDGYRIFLSNLDDEPVAKLSVPIISPKKSNTDIPDYGIKIEVKREIKLEEVLFILDRNNGGVGFNNIIDEQKFILRRIFPVIESIFAISAPQAMPPLLGAQTFWLELIPENKEDISIIQNKYQRCIPYSLSYHAIGIHKIFPHTNQILNENLSVFLPYSLALRLFYRNEQQMPFMLFYRILEGFSEKGDFSSRANQKQFKKYLRLTYDFIKQNNVRTVKLTMLKNSLQNIFDGLQLDDENTKIKIGKIDNGEKFLKVLKQLRNNITHFDYDKSEKHHYPHLHQDLEQLNYMLSIFCNVMIKDKLNIELNLNQIN